MIDDALKIQAAQKQAAAQAALAYVAGHAVIGVGTGSTANYFIDALASIRSEFSGAIASSVETEKRLQHHGIPVLDFNTLCADQLEKNFALQVYVDGADEISPQGVMIKGGGGALTREKIIAHAAQEYICIADASKLVTALGSYPLPVEIIPLACHALLQTISSWNYQPRLRLNQRGKPYCTEHGGWIVDIAGLHLADVHSAQDFERRLNDLPGIITVGLFAKRGANRCFLGTAQGVKHLQFP